jgi:RNA polymerase sigma-70 factor, ECF subfamily
MAISKAAPVRTKLVALAPVVREQLGRQLQAAYAELDQPVLPERFKALIEQLEQVLSSRDARDAAEFKRGLLAALPSLRAFAISLAHNSDRADDLVQETILKAWKNQHRYEPGTKLVAWLFTILRNLFFSEYRRRREVQDSDGIHASQLKSAPEQIHHAEMHDLQVALQKLPPDQREALLLVGAEGLSYEETAAITGVAVGTVKSRVNRARGRLADLMGYSRGDPDEDSVLQSALGPAPM